MFIFRILFLNKLFSDWAIDQAFARCICCKLLPPPLHNKREMSQILQHIIYHLFLVKNVRFTLSKEKEKNEFIIFFSIFSLFSLFCFLLKCFAYILFTKSVLFFLPQAFLIGHELLIYIKLSYCIFMNIMLIKRTTVVKNGIMLLKRRFKNLNY